MNIVQCDICGAIYSSKGIGTHIWRKHGDGKNHNPNIGYKTDREVWNKNLSKYTDDRVKKIGQTYSNKIKSGLIIPPFLGKTHTLEAKAKISKKMSVNNKGGRCKWYDFEKNTGEIVRLQGTWEVRFAKILEIIDPNWIKISLYSKYHSFDWIDDNGINHVYTPDFYSPKSNTFYEVKGFWWGNDKNKMYKVFEQNNVNIKMIFKKELEQYEANYLK